MYSLRSLAAAETSGLRGWAGGIVRVCVCVCAYEEVRVRVRVRVSGCAWVEEGLQLEKLSLLRSLSWLRSAIGARA